MLLLLATRNDKRPKSSDISTCLLCYPCCSIWLTNNRLIPFLTNNHQPNPPISIYLYRLCDILDLQPYSSIRSKNIKTHLTLQLQIASHLLKRIPNLTFFTLPSYLQSTATANPHINREKCNNFLSPGICLSCFRTSRACRQ